MGDRIKTSLDPDLHEEVLHRHQRTGKSKSQIVNEMAREGYEAETATFAEQFYSNLGAATFVAGGVVGIFQSVPIALGMVLFGVMLMLWGSMKAHMNGNGMSTGQALKTTLGF